MDKLTKIIATLGPSSMHEQTIAEMIKMGVNVFRFNFKHNEIEWHENGIDLVHAISKKMNIPVAILLDLQGPSVHIHIQQEKIHLVQNEIIPFGDIIFKEGKKGVSLSYPTIISHLKVGQHIITNDGAVVMEVLTHDKKKFLKVLSGGIVSNNKNVTIPNAHFPLPILETRDYEGLKLASEKKVDYIAISFVRTSEDLKEVQKILTEYKCESKIISKIETKKAISNLSDIIKYSDGVMVARGDLGVELPFYEVPYYQKYIIRQALKAGICVITATQMLESMIESEIATRAEVSDIANACYDLTDAVMLSGETAYGKYPLKAVNIMARTVAHNERQFTHDVRTLFDFETSTNEAEICEMAYGLYVKLSAKKKKRITGFLVFTQSGKTARLLSRYRPKLPIYAFVPHAMVQTSLAAFFGVYPYLHKPIIKNDQIVGSDVIEVVSLLKKEQKMKKGDQIIVLHGDVWAREGGTSTVKLVTVT